MKQILNKRLLYCFMASLFLNTYFFLNQLNLHKNLEHVGIKSVAYFKMIPSDQLQFNQKIKYGFQTVDKYFFVTNKRDTIWDMRKSHYSQYGILPDRYLPMDTVIYPANDPANYEFILNYNSYSIRRSAFAYFFISQIIFTACLYFFYNLIRKFMNKEEKE
ncbi:MAG TPA: hypothetical protein VK796_09665 [Cytophaga sp.]|jgi:hypothetical protein|nr:hypothetical protein [Cytophaga sp.]